MAKTKTEKITSIEEEIRQLENKRRQLVQEQKAQERREMCIRDRAWKHAGGIDCSHSIFAVMERRVR